MEHAKFYVGVGLGLAAAIALVLFDASLGPRPPIGLPRTDALDVCAPGLAPLETGGCFAVPEKEKARGVIVYLHGMFPPSLWKEEAERQSRVARIAAAQGYAVLAFRGDQGECKNDDVVDFICWPSNARNVEDAPRFVARWSASLAAMERLVGPVPRYLLGFSNGGYFASVIAARELLDFSAVAIAHAGAAAQMSARGKKPPVLLLSADDDPSDPDVGAFDATLTRERWPHAVIARDGGHALLDWDVSRSVTFFTRTKTERWPLTPSLGRGRNPHASTSPGASGAPSSSTAAVAIEVTAPEITRDAQAEKITEQEPQREVGPDE